MLIGSNRWKTSLLPSFSKLKIRSTWLFSGIGRHVTRRRSNHAKVCCHGWMKAPSRSYSETIWLAAIKALVVQAGGKKESAVGYPYIPDVIHLYQTPKWRISSCNICALWLCPLLMWRGIVDDKIGYKVWFFLATFWRKVTTHVKLETVA